MELIEQVIRIVETRYPQPDLALTSVAETLDLSSRHLGRLFQRHLGKHFRQHVRDVRMARAATYLADRRHPVKKVTAMVGYSSRRHFDEDFRKRMGCTPAQFRKKALRNSVSES